MAGDTMRAVVNGKLYVTEISELVHRLKEGPNGNSRALYLSPNGAYFCVYERFDRDPYVQVLGEGMHAFDGVTERVLGRPHDPVALAIKWLEWHGGSEVILERWPDRLEAG